MRNHCSHDNERLYIPLKEVFGSTLKYSREVSLPDFAFRAVSEAYTPDVLDVDALLAAPKSSPDNGELK